MVFSKSFFLAAAEVYGARRTCVVFDQRGHGDTEAERFDFPAMASDWGAVLDAMGWERAALGGTSLGAATALRFTLDHPERVSALLQDLPGFGPEGKRPAEQVRRMAEAFAAGDLEEALRRIGEGMGAPRARAWAEALRRDWSGYDGTRLGAKLARALEASVAWRVTERWPEDLARVKVRCRILAVQGDPIHPWSTAEEMRAAIPGAGLVPRVQTLDPAGIARQWIEELES
jgi:pimeloyl-ACP methyl ester carboxylesterase